MRPHAPHQETRQAGNRTQHTTGPSRSILNPATPAHRPPKTWQAPLPSSLRPNPSHPIFLCSAPAAWCCLLLSAAAPCSSLSSLCIADSFSCSSCSRERADCSLMALVVLASCRRVSLPSSTWWTQQREDKPVTAHTGESCQVAVLVVEAAQCGDEEQFLALTGWLDEGQVM